jgi:alkanesulfonate monooxygenase SsuD/methylene tetrahydromethanopterin reductase-like flavin-dependent oxidoreductase (luciferase family)
VIEFGIYLNGVNMSYLDMRSRWLISEKAGFDYIWMMDNVVGPVPFVAEEPVLDTWTVLPALAEATETIKFGTLVTPYGRRRPAVVAKSATILDHVSNGRFNLGMGPGDEERQHEPWGQEFPKPAERIAQLREELRIIKMMFTEEKSTFSGKYHTVTEAVNFPKPVQKPHPPIWIGLVFGKQLMPKLAAEYADGINFYNASDEYVLELMSIARDRTIEFGRDFSTIKLSRNIGITITQEPIDWDDFVRQSAEEAGVPTEYMSEYFRVYECHVVGTPEQVAQGIFDHTIALGINQPVIQVNSGGLKGNGDLKLFEENVKITMNEIAPRVREIASLHKS